MLTSKFTNKSDNNFLQIIFTLTLHVRVNIMSSLQKSWKKKPRDFFFFYKRIYIINMYMTKHEKIDGMNKINFNNSDMLRHTHKNK